MFLPIWLFCFPWFLEWLSQKGLQFLLTYIIIVGLIKIIISLIFTWKWALLWYKKELVKVIYDLIPSLPRDILNRKSLGLFCLIGSVTYRELLPVWSHFQFLISVMEPFAQRTFWRSKQGSAPVSTSISTLMCYQTLSFHTNCFQYVRANTYD